jgi:hypothetical protein
MAIGSGASIALVGLQRACLAATDLNGAATQLVLSQYERNILSAIAETILPETETPGAIEAGVPRFVELILSDWHTAEERQPVLDGMARLDQDCKSAYGKGFAECGESNPAAALAATQDSTMFTTLKALVVNGYFTSELGATSQAGYNPMPGVYREVIYDATTGQWV